MGMHIGLICAKATVDRFKAAFVRTWPQLEIVAAATLTGVDAVEAWIAQHTELVPAVQWSKDNPGRDVYVFWQNGPWAVLRDDSYVLASDDDNLMLLSSEFGRVLSFVVETTGGCACFSCFENGSLRRRISNEDADVITEGQPIAEEAGIDMKRYYMAETESLWKAFGLTPYEINETQAICVVDRTDYGQQSLPRGEPSSDRPWWKIW